jgi:hypothetical protein
VSDGVIDSVVDGVASADTELAVAEDAAASDCIAAAVVAGTLGSAADVAGVVVAAAAEADALGVGHVEDAVSLDAGVADGVGVVDAVGATLVAEGDAGG